MIGACPRHLLGNSLKDLLLRYYFLSNGRSAPFVWRLDRGVCHRLRKGLRYCKITRMGTHNVLAGFKRGYRLFGSPRYKAVDPDNDYNFKRKAVTGGCYLQLPLVKVWILDRETVVWSNAEEYSKKSFGLDLSSKNVILWDTWACSWNGRGPWEWMSMECHPRAHCCGGARQMSHWTCEHGEHGFGMLLGFCTHNEIYMRERERTRDGLTEVHLTSCRKAFFPSARA